MLWLEFVGCRHVARDRRRGKRRERRQPRRVVIAARSDSRVLRLSCLVWRVRFVPIIRI